MIKEQARNKKLEKDVAQGCTGVNAKSQRVKDQEDVPAYQCQVPSFGRPEDESVDLNAARGRAPARARAKERVRTRREERIRARAQEDRPTKARA